MNSALAKLQADQDKLPSITSFNDSNIAENPSFSSNSVKFTCKRDVKLLIKRMSNKTSCSWDGIPNIILKHLTKKIITDYTIIINNSINNRYFPTAWKIARLIILKKKKEAPIELDNLRPISILPAISKIHERSLKKSIKEFCIKNKVISDHQFVFKDGHSTTYAITTLTSEINNHLNKGESVGACLIDLRKAFDSVWLEGLIYKLIQIKMPIDLIEMIFGRKLIVSNQIYKSVEFLLTLGL